LPTEETTSPPPKKKIMRKRSVPNYKKGERVKTSSNFDLCMIVIKDNRNRFFIKKKKEQILAYLPSLEP